jgi:hypothetical protein
MMDSTRPTPPWVPVDYFAQTFLEKTIVARIAFTNAPAPGELNVEYAREYLFVVPTTEWNFSGGQ